MNRAATATCASSVATGALLIVGSQIFAPGAAAAQPAPGGAHTAAPAPVPLPAELAALAALPEVEAVLDQFAAVPDFSAVAPPAAAVPAMPSSSAVPVGQAPWGASMPQPLAVTPVSGTLTSAFGPRWGSSHAGLDIANSIGTPVYAAASGTVIDSGPASGFGLWVQVRHDDGSTSTYGHINETLVTEGQRVQAGEQIATVGNRGQSTGPHLHFETTDPAGAKVDPAQWLQQRGAPTADLSQV
ncbi:M23 family metallopeptidase [Rhodococcus artemisiae]|uniref:M23 family metallopeptidase n=1 Tax=Rhodococcus artemisiae TaxID=714159 RepID=A0ABU7LJI3_9NOCA|nr:M23 family metallopeptidase [Rhodococcus artemisiae]MEE2061719.1 M23 family metallopeptidase [Rhodococcus artemisiae]